MGYRSAGDRLSTPIMRLPSFVRGPGLRLVPFLDSFVGRNIETVSPLSENFVPSVGGALLVTPALVSPTSFLFVT